VNVKEGLKRVNIHSKSNFPVKLSHVCMNLHLTLLHLLIRVNKWPCLAAFYSVAVLRNIHHSRLTWDVVELLNRFSNCITDIQLPNIVCGFPLLEIYSQETIWEDQNAYLAKKTRLHDSMNAGLWWLLLVWCCGIAKLFIYKT